MVDAAINLQSFLQWLAAGVLSLVSILVALKIGLKDLKTSFSKLEEDVEKGFISIKSELDKIKETQISGSQKILLLEYRVDHIEKEQKEMKEKS